MVPGWLLVDLWLATGCVLVGLWQLTDKNGRQLNQVASGASHPGLLEPSGITVVLTFRNIFMESLIVLFVSYYVNLKLD